MPGVAVADTEEVSAGDEGICRVWLRLKEGVEGGGPARELPLPLGPEGNAGRCTGFGVCGVCTEVADVDRSFCGGVGPRGVPCMRSNCACDCGCGSLTARENGGDMTGGSAFDELACMLRSAGRCGWLERRRSAVRSMESARGGSMLLWRSSGRMGIAEGTCGMGGANGGCCARKAANGGSGSGISSMAMPDDEDGWSSLNLPSDSWRSR